MSNWWVLPTLVTVIAAAGAAVVLRQLQAEVDELRSRLARLRATRGQNSALDRDVRRTQGQVGRVDGIIAERRRR